MKRLLLPLLAALALPTAVNANVDPEVHKLCLPAADYSGCLESLTTERLEADYYRNKKLCAEWDGRLIKAKEAGPLMGIKGTWGAMVIHCKYYKN
tara:strand:+ start:214 stop:498 length:285 start_codon:yes stop_codon:yes gene_type:complete